MDEAAAARVLAGLDDQQQAVVAAPAGPVCVLAGAGTGKTRAITHRIAYRVLTGEVMGGHVLAVTFTARAAGELRGRLRELGALGVSARTFHSAALRQLRYFAPRVWGDRMPELIDSKVRLVTQAGARKSVRLDRTRLRDVIGELEWAKTRVIEPADYVTAAVKFARDTPLPAEQIADIYREYETLKREASLIDFEDVLLSTSWLLSNRPDVAAQIRGQYRHFVVDEFQDLSPLQELVLQAWLGERDDVTVVGDASQTIYSFAGASADFLLDFPHHYPGATVVRLERDYRSTPQVVSVANEIIAAATGKAAQARLTLIGQRTDGPKPTTMEFADEPAEAAAVARRCSELIATGTSAAEIAVLFRINAQSQTYEQALAEAGVPYVVVGAEKFFDRPEVREAMVLLRGAARASEISGERGALATDVAAALSGMGFNVSAPPSGGASRERWEALVALVRLAEQLADRLDLRGFVDELVERAAIQHAPVVAGVTLASLHAAKGLEWDAVFVVGVADGTLPISYATTEEQLEEERRLLYVGVTRARERLWLSWAKSKTPGGRQRRASRFLPGASAGQRVPKQAVPGATKARAVPTCRSCGTALFDAVQRKIRRCSSCPATYDEELFESLREWRTRVAGEQKLPAYCVLTDATLQAIAADTPTTESALTTIPGIGPRKLALYGNDVIEIVSQRAAASSDTGDTAERA